MNTEDLLKVIVADAPTHARWLNSLSYLEYRGFRKIVRSRSTEEMSLDVLLHAAEEVRHSVFFKKMAIRIGGRSFTGFNEDTLLCSAALKSYFFEVDAQSTRAIDSVGRSNLSRAAYSLVTWLVEKRAMVLYEEYEKLLNISSASFSLSGILREERLHLKEMGTEAERFLLHHGFNAGFISEIETNEFRKLCLAIKNEIFERRMNAQVRPAL